MTVHYPNKAALRTEYQRLGFVEVSLDFRDARFIQSVGQLCYEFSRDFS